MQVAFAIEQIESKYRSLASVLDERARRHWAATEARAYCWGGVSAVSEATGMSPNTIRKGLAELAAREGCPDFEMSSRLRKPGGGRKRLSETDPQLSVELDRLVAPLTRGDPESPEDQEPTSDDLPAFANGVQWVVWIPWKLHHHLETRMNIRFRRKPSKKRPLKKAAFFVF